MCFLSAALGKALRVDVARAHSDLCHSTTTPDLAGRHCLDPAFICALDFQCPFLMISKRSWFPTHVTREQRFLPSPPCWHS